MPMKRSTTLILCMWVTMAQAAAQEPAGGKERRLGRLPDWAAESWVIRRQMETPLALVGGHVVNVADGSILENATIVIKGDVILSIGLEAPPKNANTVDIHGRYVIPGLFDLHAHVIPKSLFFPNAKDPESALQMLLDHGVTTIRALPMHVESALQWASGINAGHMTGPTIVAASGIYERQAQRTSLGFGASAVAENWVHRDALLGARWIKVYNSMDEKSLETIIQTAQRFGIRVCGHTEDVPPHRASALGIGSIEHIISIPLSCSFEGAVVESRSDLVALTVGRWAAVDDGKLDVLLETLRRNRTAWVPTLVVTERMMRIGSHDGEATEVEAAEEAETALQETIRRAARAAVRQHRAGGLVGLGTDFPVDGVEPGESVHRELEIFVTDGGATTLEALQIGTISSSRILGFEAILGTLEPGKIANLVVLRENPMEDISRVRGIDMVIHDGRIHRPSAPGSELEPSDR